MRTFIAVLSCLIFTPYVALCQLEDFLPAPGEIKQDRENTQNSASLRGDDIWIETFENGIPADWENSEISDIAHWEYRGPETTPDIYIGSRGSCIPEGEAGSEPIESPTWADGFAIFDSNYWDDNLGPCIEGFGTGPSPAPHDGWLATPPVDLSEYEAVFFAFNHFFKEWATNTQAVLEYKSGGSDWEVLHEIVVESGNATAPDEEVVINVTEQAAGTSDFQIRFRFIGTYYYWMIDDVRFVEPDANNIVINDASFAEFDLFDPGNESGFEGLEYTMYPDEMSPTFDFEVEVFNAGAETQTDVILHVVIVNIETQDTIYNETSLSSNLITQQVSWFETPSFSMPAGFGEFEIHYSISQNEEDEVPEDNTFVFAFNINDVTYAKDFRATEGIYVPSNQFFSTPYEVGNMFLMTADDLPVHSISAGVGLGSTAGVPVYGAIYKLNLTSFADTELIAETGGEDIYWEAMNDFGQNQMMVLPFDEPVTLMKDSAYLVVAGANAGSESVLFATSGPAEPLSSWVRFQPNNWFYLEQNPMVRMNFGQVVNIEKPSLSDATLFTNFPNPFNASTTVRFNLQKASACRIEITDIQGRTVRSRDLGTLPIGDHFLNVHRENLADGTYVFSLIANNIRHSESIVISR
ncbi:MAG: T9SS type A sorting domain-containing protein [Flavobacteriales bacterium]|nr:T9SS type A sorting domain-containing protein [Flavobacteriales bacterium]